MVDLPAPFFPAKPTRSFPLIKKLTFSNKELPPKATVTEFTDIIFLQ
jgi:hypothetical protein